MRQAKWAVIAGALVLGGGASARNAADPGMQGASPGSDTAGQSNQGTGGMQGMQGSMKHGATSSAKGMRSIVGTVDSVQGDTLTLKTKSNKTDDLELGDSTRYFQRGKKISKDDVKQGDQVKAEYHRDASGQLQASVIRVIRSSSQGPSMGSSGASSSQSQEGASSGASSDQGQQGASSGSSNEPSQPGAPSGSSSTDQNQQGGASTGSSSSDQDQGSSTGSMGSSGAGSMGASGAGSGDQGSSGSSGQ